MNPQQAKKLGRRLRSAREGIGISARELARRVAVPDSTIVRLEQGAFAEPSAEKLLRIAHVLDIDLSDLFAAAGYPSPALPALRPYLRQKYDGLHAEDVDAIERYAQRLALKRGVDLRGPKPGEDERDDPAPNRSPRGGRR